MAAKRKGPFIIAYGGENYLLDKALERGRAWPDRALVTLDGDGLADHELVEICEASGQDNQVVVVDNAEKLKGSKQLAAYIEAKDVEDHSTLLIAVLRSETLSEPWKSAAKKGTSYCSPGFKPWEQDKVSTLVNSEASKIGLTLESDVAPTLIKALGFDVRRIVNELQKARLVSSDGKITRKTLLPLLSQDIPAEPFNVSEAATSKELKTALNLVSILYRNLGDNAAVPIVIAMLKQVEKLLIARDMLDRGDSIEIISTRLGMHKFPLEKNFLPKARRYTVNELSRHMTTLCRLESKVKGGASSSQKRTLVELAVVEIASLGKTQSA